MSEQRAWYYWREADSGKRLGRADERAFAEEVAAELAAEPNGHKPARNMEVVDEHGTVLSSYPAGA